MSIISIEDFSKKFGLRNRVVTLKSTGDQFKVRSLNMEQKRTIREENMSINLGVGRGQEEKQTALDLEGMVVDTIIAACQDPKFDENSRDWMLNSIDSNYINELFEAIDTPVKLATLTPEKLGN